MQQHCTACNCTASNCNFFDCAAEHCSCCNCSKLQLAISHAPPTMSEFAYNRDLELLKESKKLPLPMTRGGALSLQGLIGSLRDHTCTAAMQDNCDTSLMQLLQTHQLQNHNAHATRH